jgi:RNA polymerase sigma-70 factor (ECF subfamily)
VDDLTRIALAAQAGDDEALSALIRGTQADVWRLCAHLAGRGRADDLTQETFLRAWRALPRYHAESSVRTWLLAIARNTAIDALRAARRRPQTTALLDHSGHVEPDATALVATEQLLAALDPDRRTALFLTQILGLSYAEAADICRVPVGTIRSRVARGRDDLAAVLAAADERQA